MAVNIQLFTRKLDEVYNNVNTFVKRQMHTYVDEAQLEKVDESEQPEVYKIFAETILEATRDALGYYIEPPYIENPTLNEAHKRVDSISGKLQESGKKVATKLKESFDDEVKDAIENFCILMDWEVSPEDIKSCEHSDDGLFEITTNSGENFTYDIVNDQIL